MSKNTTTIEKNKSLKTNQGNICNIKQTKICVHITYKPIRKKMNKDRYS